MPDAENCQAKIELHVTEISNDCIFSTEDPTTTNDRRRRSTSLTRQKLHKILIIDGEDLPFIRQSLPLRANKVVSDNLLSCSDHPFTAKPVQVTRLFLLTLADVQHNLFNSYVFQNIRLQRACKTSRLILYYLGLLYEYVNEQVTGNVMAEL